MELRHLRYFVAAAETENVSRAVLKLHVSQPALSRQIRDLEDEIGFCLLERTAKSVRLTDAGRAFLNDARTLLQQADEAVKKARAIASAEPTELKVGYSPAATARILPPILRAYQRVMPKVHVKLHDWSNEENVAGLRDGRLSLAFVVRPPKAVLLEGIRFEELIRERICLAVPPHHAFATRRSVSLTDAASEPFIGLTREEYPDYYDYLSVTFSKVTETAGGGGARQRVRCNVISRSRYWDRYRSGSVRLQFRKPCEALASYSRAETNLNRHRRAKEPT